MSGTTAILNQAAGLMHLPTETEEEWTARTGGWDALNQMGEDLFAEFRTAE